MAYSDPGSIAVDNENGDLTGDIVITGEDQVDETTEGTYSIVHTVHDSDGASASVTRKIHILKENDYDFHMRFKTYGASAPRFYFSGSSMYYSLNGVNYQPYNSNIGLQSGAYIHLRGKNITYFSCALRNSLTEIMIYKAYDLTSSASMFYRQGNLTKFEVAHPNVMFNSLTFSQMFQECSILESFPELNYSNVTNTQTMFYQCTALKCIKGTIYLQSSTNTGAMFAGTNLVAPNEASRASILNGNSWTNPGTCDETTQTSE